MLKKGRGYIYDITYYIAWYTNEGTILDNYSLSLLNTMFYDIAKDYNFTISNLHMTSNYIYLEVDCKPQHYIPNLLKLLKGITARRLLTLNPDLKESLSKGRLWKPDYYVTTTPGILKCEKTK